MGGETPLMMAVEEGNIHCMQLLFDQANKAGCRGPDTSIVTVSGRTVAHIGNMKGPSIMQPL